MSGMQPSVTRSNAAVNCCHPETLRCAQFRDNRPVTGHAARPESRANQPLVGGQGPLMRRIPNPPPPANRNQAHPAKTAMNGSILFVADGQQKLKNFQTTIMIAPHAEGKMGPRICLRIADHQMPAMGGKRTFRRLASDGVVMTQRWQGSCE